MDEKRRMREDGRGMRDEGRKENKQDQNCERSENLSQGLRQRHCGYIDEETFQRLDDNYEHIFAMLNAHGE
jgi:hypothetical protein